MGAQISAQNSPLSPQANCIWSRLPDSPIHRLQPAEPAQPTKIMALGFSRSPSQPVNN